MKKCSVILFVPTGNQLDLCLKSLLAQTSVPEEIILLHFKKTSPLINKIIGNKKLKKFIINKANQSVFTNIAKKHSGSEINLFLDEYCLLSPNWINTCINSEAGCSKIISKDGIHTNNGIIGTAQQNNAPASACMIKEYIYYVEPKINNGRIIKYPLWYIKECAKKADVLWTVLIIDPIAIPLTWATANFTRLTPNIITFISFLISLLSAFFFLQGTHMNVLAGGLLYELSFLLDCIDGKLSRAKIIYTPLGHFSDQLKDRLSLIINLFALGYGQFLLTSDSVYLLLIFIYILFDAYKRIINIYFLQAKSTVSSTIQNAVKRVDIYFYLNNKLLKHRIRLKMVDVELEALVFLFGPLIYQIKTALLFAIAYQLFFLVFVTLYKVDKLRKMSRK